MKGGLDPATFSCQARLLDTRTTPTKTLKAIILSTLVTHLYLTGFPGRPWRLRRAHAATPKTPPPSSRPYVAPSSWDSYAPICSNWERDQFFTLE